MSGDPGNAEADNARQVRYAVVLNGGVSLAVWMGGVTHEINRIRLASLGWKGGQGAKGNLRPWEKILKACNRTAVVDLIAGTSAGGLNGTLLAVAVARGSDLPDMKSKWATVASLHAGALVWPDPSKADSVLNGPYFEDQVRSIVDSIAPKDEKDKRECTLLVTATALDSTPIRTPLQTGAEISLRDGRRVYRFERKLGPEIADAAPHIRDDFERDGVLTPVLVRAARASASFPGAFAPVWELPELAKKRVLPKDPGIDESWLVDGGVLDNAPFEPLLEALRERPTDEPYERVMLYVTPGVGLPEGAASKAEGTPSLRETFTSVLAAIREPDERLDADSLRKIFTQMSYSRSQAHYVIYEFLRDPEGSDANEIIEAAKHVFEPYRESRAEAFERQQMLVAGDRTSPFQPPHPSTLEPDDVPGMPRLPFAAPEGNTWDWGWPVADRVLRWWGRAMARLEALPDQERRGQIKTAMQIVANCQREVAGLCDVLDVVARGGPTDDKSPAAQRARLRRLYETGSDELTAIYGPGAGSLSTRLGICMTTAVGAIQTEFQQESLSNLVKLSLGVEVLSGMLAWGSDDYDVPEFRFHNVTPGVDVPPGIPLEWLGNQPSWPLKKLYGQRLGHFGAFASEEGRNNDWLWGRLDGASELSRQLLAAAGVNEDEADRLRKALIEEILKNEGQSAAEVVDNARKAFKLPARELIDGMASRDDGRSLMKLEDTLWTLSHQFGTAGFWLRVVLAPDWSRDEMQGRNFAQKLWIPGLRAACGIIRRRIRKGLPKEMSMKSRHALRAQEAAPPPTIVEGPSEPSIGARAGQASDED